MNQLPYRKKHKHLVIVVGKCLLRLNLVTGEKAGPKRIYSGNSVETEGRSQQKCCVILLTVLESSFGGVAVVALRISGWDSKGADVMRGGRLIS